MIYYKLTDQNMQTYNGFQWKIGIKKTTSGQGSLCTSGWLHFYHSPLLSILLNPIHSNIAHPRLFEAECCGRSLDDNGLKIGYSESTLIREIPIPVITILQRIAFGILCAEKVHKKREFQVWAKDWLAGTDRSVLAAEAAKAAAGSAAEAAAARAAIAAAGSAAEAAAARAAIAAAGAAEAAARSAAAAAEAARAAAWAARSAAWAARAAAWAAEAARAAIAAAGAAEAAAWAAGVPYGHLNLVDIAEESIQYK